MVLEEFIKFKKSDHLMKCFLGLCMMEKSGRVVRREKEKMYIIFKMAFCCYRIKSEVGMVFVFIIIEKRSEF